MYSGCPKVNLNRKGSYIDSPDWTKRKKETIDLKNAENKCFQYMVTVALNYEVYKWNPERVSNIKINIVAKE